MVRIKKNCNKRFYYYDKVVAYGEVMTRSVCHTADWTRKTRVLHKFVLSLENGEGCKFFSLHIWTNCTILHIIKKM